MNEKEITLNGLEPLFEQAEKEGLWFYSSYQDMWFSPKELRDCHAHGRFIWGAVNWQLRNPQEKIDLLERQKVNIDKQIEEFREEMAK